MKRKLYRCESILFVLIISIICIMKSASISATGTRIIFADENSNKLSNFYTAIFAEAILSIPDGNLVMNDLLTKFDGNNYLKVICKYNVRENRFHLMPVDGNTLKHIVTPANEKAIIHALDSLISNLQLKDRMLLPNHYIYHDEATPIHIVKELSYIFSSRLFQVQWDQERKYNKKLDPIIFIRKWIANVLNTPVRIYRINNLPKDFSVNRMEIQEWEDSVRNIPCETIRFKFH